MIKGKINKISAENLMILFAVYFTTATFISDTPRFPKPPPSHNLLDPTKKEMQKTQGQSKIEYTHTSETDH